MFLCIAPQVIMSLVQKHGKEHISIASFGLTAVSNLIHTDSSKDKFGSLGECVCVCLTWLAAVSQ
jgi:hypothetical protein